MQPCLCSGGDTVASSPMLADVSTRLAVGLPLPLEPAQDADQCVWSWQKQHDIFSTELPLAAPPPRASWQPPPAAPHISQAPRLDEDMLASLPLADLARLQAEQNSAADLDRQLWEVGQRRIHLEHIITTYIYLSRYILLLSLIYSVTLQGGATSRLGHFPCPTSLSHGQVVHI